MFKLKHIALAITFLFSGMLCGFNPPSKKGDRNGKGVRLGFGPVVGFYSIDRNHAKGVLPRISALITYKKEIRFGRDYRTFFLYGLDYFIHGINFNSYYFKPDTIKLYDKKLNYKYSLYFQEINVPLQVKYSFNRENNSQYTHYFMIGYHLRYLLPASLKVTQNGNTIKEDNPQMKFKNYFITEQLNAFVSASLGWQKNNTASSKVGIYIEGSYRYGFSPYYFETNYSASSMFVNSSHICVQVGLKF